MKIGILTLPSSFNYGGILQAFAMQHILDKLGYDNVILRRERPIVAVNNKGAKVICKNFIKKILGRDIYAIPNEEQKQYIEVECRRFIEANLRKTTQAAYDTDQLAKLCCDNEVSTIIVGSDQVWRPHMTANIRNYFLDFCGDKIKKIAYAASFGVDNWEYSYDDTALCSELAKEFNLVTVREDSGVRLCKEYLGVEAKHVLDPTMLLTSEDYVSLVEKSSVPKSKGNLFCYILDENKAKSNFVRNVTNRYGLEPFRVLPKRDAYFNNNADKFIEECIYPSPAVWIRAFMDAECVVTDSFHGTVFSIIFNKPFWVIGNKSRGNARFESLLKMFHLEHRYIYDIKNVKMEDLVMRIDWDEVNKIRQEKKMFSIHLLREALNG